MKTALAIGLLFALGSAGAEHEDLLEAARQASLEYGRQLPDFLCTQVVRRSVMQGRNWKLRDTLLVQIAYSAGHEEYQLAAVNGKPSSRRFEGLEGAVNTGEFGGLLQRLFSREYPADFHWESEATLRGRAVHVFAYSVKPEFARHKLTFGDVRGVRSIFVSDHGLVYVDAETKQTMKIVSMADHIPQSFPIHRSDTTVDYDFVEIAGKRYLAPLQAEVVAASDRETTRNEVQFAGYRKFSVEERITYQRLQEKNK